jgi:hypothetical protein
MGDMVTVRVRFRNTGAGAGEVRTWLEGRSRAEHTL